VDRKRCEVRKLSVWIVGQIEVDNGRHEFILYGLTLTFLDWRQAKFLKVESAHWPLRCNGLLSDLSIVLDVDDR
jgi:hypothetical protein